MTNSEMEIMASCDTSSNLDLTKSQKKRLRDLWNEHMMVRSKVEEHDKNFIDLARSFSHVSGFFEKLTGKKAKGK